MHWATFSVVAMVLGGMSAKSSATNAADSPQWPTRLWVYVGTYTEGTASKGIYRLELDLARGELKSCGLAVAAANPSYVAIHPTRPRLYAVSEVGGGPTRQQGKVIAFTIEPRSGKLTPLNQQSSGGAGPCHVLVDHSGKCVLAANYGSGSIACLPIAEDGRLDAPGCVVQHAGSSVHPQRQKGPHAHSTTLDVANRFAFACDLGLDKIMIYRLDAARGLLTASDPPAVGVSPGSGPRLLVFHPEGRFAYVVDELSSGVDVFAYDAPHGRLAAIQSISTLPPAFAGSNTAADLQIHPSGKFLYASNRGHDSIAMFAIDETTGKLSPLGHQSTQGKVPRHFGIDPSGTFLLAANQASDNVVLFRIGADGKLAPTGASLRIAAPVCVKMMQPLE